VVANPLEDADRDGDMSENETVLPYFMEEGGLRESAKEKDGDATWGRRRRPFVKSMLDEALGERLGMPYVSCLYDARRIYDSGMCARESELETKLLKPIVDLAEAMSGDFEKTDYQSYSKVPVISVPHGLVTDGGYALLGSSYALATDATSYRVLHPLRGLTLDPVGSSYSLTRCGREFRQKTVMQHSWGCALLVALTGYEANAVDLVTTGLATHYIGGPYKLNMLERGLMNINSYDGQRLKRNPRRLYGHEHEVTGPDINDEFRNVAVGNLIQSISEYDAAGADEYGCYLKNELDDDQHLFLKEKDPSLRMSDERIQMYGELVSPLVSWAATFSSVWEEESVEGIMERLREIASQKSKYEGKLGYEEDAAVAEQAEYLVSCMEARSPLALEVTYGLLCAASDEEETWQSCVVREKRAQMKLMTQSNGDFARWAESGQGVGLISMEGKASLIRQEESVFTGWNHASVKDVTEDEVAAILGDDSSSSA
jgi:enoyl-CoA hydratase/carnithine racemase